MYIFLKLIRFSQWQKNYLVFLPFIMANEYNFENIYNSAEGFFIFSFAASLVYIFNDFIDLDKDSKHPSKKYRPLASRSISKKNAFLIAIIFLFLTLYFGYINQVLAILLVYLILNIFYSFLFKKIRYLDVIILSSFYIVRIYFGGEISNIEISLWLYIFCSLAFISLVLLKRINEIEKYQLTNTIYSNKNLKILNIYLKSSNILSVVSLILYLLSDKVFQIYNFPQFLWLLLPLYIFWMININRNALVGKMSDDPVTFVITNKKSYISILLMGSVIFIAQFVNI